ncbi:hypothetical protein Tco_0355106 [Tanacetum coccineum]
MWSTGSGKMGGLGHYRGEVVIMLLMKCTHVCEKHVQQVYVLMSLTPKQRELMEEFAKSDKSEEEEKPVAAAAAGGSR